MQVSGQLQDPNTLLPAKEPPVLTTALLLEKEPLAHTREVIEWAPEIVMQG
jgi:hypothetical protein